MSKFLDSTGLSRLVENIKNKFQKKKIVCTIWDENGDIEDPIWGFDINTNNKSYYDLYVTSSGNLIYSLLHNHIYELEFYYKDTSVTPVTYTKINYQIIQDTDERLEIVFTIPLMFSSADHDVEIVTIGFSFKKDNEEGYYDQNISECTFLPTDLYKVSHIQNSSNYSNKALTGNLDYAIVPKVVEINIDTKYIITPDGASYKLKQTSSSLYNKLKVLYDTKCPIQILISSNNGKLIANNAYIYYSNNTVRLQFSYNNVNIDWEELPELRVARLREPQVIGTIYITSAGSNTYELIEENIKLTGGSCTISLYEDEPKTIKFSHGDEIICFDKDDSNYVAGNAFKIIENFKRINIGSQNNGINFYIDGLDSIYDTIISDNRNVLVNYFMSGDDDNNLHYTFVMFTHEINESNQNSPTPCIYYFNLFIDSNDPDNSITYEIKKLYYTVPISLNDKGDGTKFLADDGKYKDIKGYDKVYYKNPKEFLLSNTEEARQARSEIWTLVFNDKLCCFIDPIDKSLYHVSLDVGIEYADEGGIIKVYNNDITYIFEITAPALISEYDNSYNGSILVDYVAAAYHMQATLDDVYINAIGDVVHGSPLDIFDTNTGFAKFTTIGKYKIIYRTEPSGSHNIYVGDLIVEAPDSNNTKERKYTIKRVAGSDYYFTIAQQPVLYEDEYASLSYHDIILIDIKDNRDYYNDHVIEHNPHKNDDAIIITDENGCLPYTTKNNVGFCKIFREYFEGVRKYGVSHDTKSIYPMINYDTWSTYSETIHNNINGFFEDITITVDGTTKGCIDANDRVGLLETYIHNYSLQDDDPSASVYDPCKKVIRVINTDTSTITIPICTMGLLDMGNISYDFNQFLEYNSENNNNVYNIALRPKEVCEFIIIIGSHYREHGEAGGVVYSHNAMYITINRISNKGNLLTLEAENGIIDKIQAWTVNHAHVNNEPLYVLYSGIKMLVNSIQKLGDIWSLSCSHEGVVYNVTVDTAEMSYNVITNV